MARTSRRQPNSYRGGRVVGNLAYDERYAERRAPRRESEQRLFDAMGVSSAWIGRRIGRSTISSSALNWQSI